MGVGGGGGGHLCDDRHGLHVLDAAATHQHHLEGKTVSQQWGSNCVLECVLEMCKTVSVRQYGKW